MDVSSFRKIVSRTKVKFSFRRIRHSQRCYGAVGMWFDYPFGAGTAIKPIADRTLIKTLFILSETAKMTGT